MLPLGRRPSSTPATPSSAPRQLTVGRGAADPARARRGACARCPGRRRSRVVLFAGRAADRGGAVGVSPRRLVDPPALRAESRRGRGLRLQPRRAGRRARRRRSGRCCWRRARSRSPAARPRWPRRSASPRALGRRAGSPGALALAWGRGPRRRARRRRDRARVAGPIVWGALSGMEVSLAALLVAGALAAPRGGPRPRRPPCSLALAVLARPEAVLALRRSSGRGRPITPRRAAIFALALVGASWRPWSPSPRPRWARLLPATAAAKVEGGLLGWLAGSREPLARDARARARGSSRRSGSRWLWHGRSHSCRSLLLPGLWLALADAAAARSGFPALALLAASARDGAARALPRARLPGRPLLDPPAAARRGRGRCAGRVAAPGPRQARGAPRWRSGCSPRRSWTLRCRRATRYAWAVQNIDAMQVQLGRWVAANMPPDARLALNDIGAIAYRLAARGRGPDGAGDARHHCRTGGTARPASLRYLERSVPGLPDHLPAWFPRLAAMTDRFKPDLPGAARAQ